MKVRAIAGISLLGFLGACGGSDSASGGGGGDGGTASSSGAGASSSGASSSGSSGGASSSGDPGDGGPPQPDAGPVLVGSAPSCAQPNGGNTCGPDGNDDCCKSIAVPAATPFKLDKYNITAGRMRSFINATQGNVRGYIQAHRPDWFEPAWDKYIPSKMDDGTLPGDGTKAQTGDHTYHDAQGNPIGFDGVYQQLGPIHWGTEGAGNEGCLTKEVGNARTYRIDDATNTRLFADVQQYDQDTLDKKSLQCVDFFMVAAFCAWDGGRLPTLAELQFAWDGGQPTTHLYPWGQSPVAAGWSDAYSDLAAAMAGGSVKPANGDQKRANVNYNFFEPAEVKCQPGKNCDYSLYIAPPGRFPTGDGPFGHSDLAGNVYNVAMPMTGTPGTDPVTANRTVSVAKTGAFDIPHPVPSQHPIAPFNKWSPLQKYIAVGGRCARAM